MWGESCESFVVIFEMFQWLFDVSTENCGDWGTQDAPF